LTTVEIEIQNLRNKYQEHVVIKPLINYCEENKISFEFLKEIVPAPNGIKSFNKISTYYMKIGENLLRQEEDQCRWNDLFKLITCAYDHLKIEQPLNLLNASRAFNK
jgi:hypothetical protein